MGLSQPFVVLPAHRPAVNKSLCVRVVIDPIAVLWWKREVLRQSCKVDKMLFHRSCHREFTCVLMVDLLLSWRPGIRCHQCLLSPLTISEIKKAAKRPTRRYPYLGTGACCLWGRLASPVIVWFLRCLHSLSCCVRVLSQNPWFSATSPTCGRHRGLPNRWFATSCNGRKGRSGRHGSLA